MVRLRIIEILQEQQMTKYALWKRLDSMSYQNFNAIVTNKTSKISFETLDKFSKALETPVGELLERKSPETTVNLWTLLHIQIYFI